MKIGKEEIQKIFLGLLLLGGMLYYYFSMLLGPLNDQELKANATLNDLTPKIDAANDALRKLAPLKTKAEEAEATLEQIKSLIPEGSPVAWFPPNIIEFFKRQGIDKCSVHPAGESADRELTGFKKTSWGLDIPHVEVVKLAIAIAALENEHPLMEIGTLHIEASKETVQFQNTRLSVSTIIRE